MDSSCLDIVVSNGFYNGVSYFTFALGVTQVSLTALFLHLAPRFELPRWPIINSLARAAAAAGPRAALQGCVSRLPP